ncbi:MAG: hypothetical protein LUH14_01200 [Clostridiaceae bacterium]|nr:hypothetical protein [Clostridiaceae bacterium]
MKLIRISTDLELTVHEFPEGSHEEQNEFIRELIGNYCRIYEHIMPTRLYEDLHMKNHPTKVSGQCVSMLVDEEGLLKEAVIPNLIGCYLYKTDQHGNPIVGNILFVGEVWTEDGIDFCGIEEETFKLLELELNNMIFAMKATKEALGK